MTFFLKVPPREKKFRGGGKVGACGGRFQGEQSEREGFYPGKKSARKVRGRAWELFLMKGGRGSTLEFPHSRAKHKQEKHVYTSK